MKKRCLLMILLVTASTGLAWRPPLSRSVPMFSPAEWRMAGANPQRTGWVPEEVRDAIEPIWYRPIEPYISQKVQIVASGPTLYVSSSGGLYALEADTGAEKWVYPTEMPLGHSPSVEGGIVYVGGFDRKIHAIDAESGRRLWVFEGGKGFHTNPLVVDGAVYAGNRDGRMYAVEASTGKLLWMYETDGPILFSAAYRDGVVFFASNDSHAYALNARTGDLFWKSDKLPGAGFHSWWPVVYRNVVIFAGSSNYKNFSHADLGGYGSLITRELEDIYPNRQQDPKGTLVGPVGRESGDWVEGTPTIDASQPARTVNGTTTAVTEYLESKPWRRTYFVLNRFTGEEITYDFDGDGKQEYAPILWVGTHNGNRYPPVVGGDGVLYQPNNYMSDAWIAGGHISGWKLGSPLISLPYPPPELGGQGFAWNAVDEPIAYSAGGNLIYWNRCCDRVGGWIDITRPAGTPGLAWNMLYSYNIGYGTSLAEKMPGYNQFFHNPDPDGTSQFASYGVNGSYGWHGDTNPPIPHRGKLYMHRSNAVIAFGPPSGPPTALPPLPAEPAEPTAWSEPPVEELRWQLEVEVEKIVDAGHLRPAYIPLGLFEGRSDRCGDHPGEFFHNSSETIYALTRAYPLLSPELKSRVELYLKSELHAYPPYQYEHVGWSGASREAFDVPQDLPLAGGPLEEGKGSIWRKNPFVFYALWKYAETFGGASELLQASRDSLDPVPADSVLAANLNAHNAYIAGYLGFLNLEKLAGFPESQAVREAYERLLTMRVKRFESGSGFAGYGYPREDLAYCRALNSSNNFLYLVPELAKELRRGAREAVRRAVEEYKRVTPYWFVSNAEEGFGENATSLAYDSHALFQAQALILRTPYDRLVQYLDVPMAEVGDLYYILNLTAAIEAGSIPLASGVPQE